jgi:CDP-glucose 4,6-dehydratase
MILPSSSFWEGRQVLVTGHTGFKGSWLTFWLRRLGAEVTGVSLAPSTEPNLFTAAEIQQDCRSILGDIRDYESLRQVVDDNRPEVVFHLAAQPLVRCSYRDPLETFATNTQGTANLLEALRTASAARVVVAITTDKVYRDDCHGYPFRETDPLGGHDPYSASKAAAELVIASYRDSFLRSSGAAVATARAGNVIGGGDWSEDRLFPDAVRAWSAEKRLCVRRPDAVRPWQHVLEPLAGYLRLAEHLWERPTDSGPYNFGPPPHEATTVREVMDHAMTGFPGSAADYSESPEGPHETHWLSLEIAKSSRTLRASSTWPLREAIDHTMRWYREYYEGTPSRLLCSQDLELFERVAMDSSVEAGSS